MNSSTTYVKRFSFYAIAAMLPFIILLLLEFSLRLFNYGQSYPLFVPAKHFNGYLQPNPYIIKRYFPEKVTAPSVSPDTFLFKAKKPEATLRIVTLGGSTMAGFPYGRFASPAGMLKQRLKASNPEQNIELISVAMSSINSYTVLDMIDEVIAIQPDAVLIYAGHNEYLGVMGIGSIYASKGGHATNLLYLLVKDWRLYQLVENTYYAIFSTAESGSNNSEQRTVMAQVAKNKSIVYQDPIYSAGTQQFEDNLNRILQQFNHHNVPVFLSNLVANELDQAPFESITLARLDEATKNIHTNGYAIKADDVNLAHQQKHADYMYAVALRYAAAQDWQNAHAFFKTANDYDLLRFRAPTQFNKIIERLAHQNQATFVDTYGFMHQYAANGIIGNDLMLEHLHPNHRGYFLLAESFYQSFLATGLIHAQYDFALAQAWLMSPITQVDEIFANYKVARLMSDYPFRDAPIKTAFPEVETPIDLIALQRIKGSGWLDTQQALLKYYQDAATSGTTKLQNDTSSQQRYYTERAANVAGLLFDALPTQSHNARVASVLYLRANILPMAKYYAIQAVRLSPKNINYALTLAEIYYKLAQTQASVEQLNKVLSIDPNNQRAKQIKTYISQ